MHFTIVEMDGVFSFGDPLMTAGALYGAIWLFLAVMILISRNREFRIRRIFFHLLFILIAVFLVVRVSVFTFINIPLPSNTSLGLLSGPPFWISAAAAAAGFLIGWFVRAQRKCAIRQGTGAGPGVEGGIGRTKARTTALILSLVFPGLGQIYYGNFLTGLMVFLAVCFLAQLAKPWGLCVGYLLVQWATFKNEALVRILRNYGHESRKNGTD